MTLYIMGVDDGLRPIILEHAEEMGFEIDSDLPSPLVIAADSALRGQMLKILLSSSQRVLAILDVETAPSVRQQLLTVPSPQSKLEWIEEGPDLVEELQRWLLRAKQSLESEAVQHANKLASHILREPAAEPEPGFTESLEDFINVIAHELKTPLTPIRLQMEVASKLVDQHPDEKFHDVFALLQRNFDRLDNIVTELLEGIRLQKQEVDLDVESVNIGSIVKDSITNMGSVAKEQDIQIEHRAPLEGCVVRADGSRLGQVFDNLLSNAIKYSPSGTTITVEGDRDEHHVEITISDQGIGMDADGLRRLFRPFSRIHDQTKWNVQGTGLGLYICQNIVKAHGGAMWAESEGADKGTRFTVRLPID